MMMKGTHLNPVPFFIINRIGFPPHMIGNACCSHQITFISSINEYFRFECLATKGFKRLNSRSFFQEPSFTVEPFIAQHLNLMLPDKIFENLLGNMGLEYPHRPFFAIHGSCALSPVSVFRLLLPLPCLVVLIMQINPVVKLAGQSPDNRLASRTGESNSPGRQPPPLNVR